MMTKEDQTKEIIQTWLDQQGHDRCWYYPDLFMQLVNLYGLTPSKLPSLPPKSEFEEGCRRYQEQEFNIHK